MEDSKIIALFFERSEQAIEELDREYGAAVRKTAANILSDRQDAEECVNDAYLACWNSIPPQKPDPLVSYVCKIARNLAIKRYRSNTAEKRNSHFDAVLDELAECIPSNCNLEQDYIASEVSAAVSRYLDTLSYDDRYCFIRRYWFADAVSDIAEAMHSSSHRVSSRLYRTRKKLFYYLKEEGYLE